MAENTSAQEKRIGPDLLRIEGAELVIYSRRDMPDWVVREFSRPVIWFQEQKFFLRSREFLTRNQRWRYALSPWPDHEPANLHGSIHYDETYVAERERHIPAERARAAGHVVLLPFYPLLGFLWSGLKDRLIPLGYDPRSLTSLSLGLQLGLVTLLGILIGYLGQRTALTIVPFLLLGLDLILRYDRLLRDHPRAFGFLEWCFRR